MLKIIKSPTLGIYIYIIVSFNSAEEYVYIYIYIYIYIIAFLNSTEKVPCHIKIDLHYTILVTMIALKMNKLH